MDHALKIHLTPRGIKREVQEEEDEKRKRKRKKNEGGDEAPKEELEQLINSHQNSNDNDSFFTGFVDTHLLHIDIESSISNCCLKKSPDENWRTLHTHLICLWRSAQFFLSVFVNSLSSFLDSNGLFMAFVISWSVFPSLHCSLKPRDMYSSHLHCFSKFYITLTTLVITRELTISFHCH